MNPEVFEVLERRPHRPSRPLAGPFAPAGKPPSPLRFTVPGDAEIVAAALNRNRSEADRDAGVIYRAAPVKEESDAHP